MICLPFYVGFTLKGKSLPGAHAPNKHAARIIDRSARFVSRAVHYIKFRWLMKQKDKLQMYHSVNCTNLEHVILVAVNIVQTSRCSRYQNILSIVHIKRNGYTLFIYCQFCQEWQFLWLPVCFIIHKVSSENGSTLKGKNLLPLWANSFLLE